MTKLMRYFNFKLAALAALLIVLGIGVTIAQLPSEDGMSMVREAYKSVAFPDATGACRLEYSIRTVMLEEDQLLESVADIEYMASPDRTHCRSNRMELYADSSLMVVVDHDERSIYITVPSRAHEQQMLSSITGALPDTLFSQGQLLRWEKLDGAKQSSADGPNMNRRAVVRPPENLRKFTMIDTVTVLLNSTNRQLGKITLKYLPDCGVDRIEATYKKIEMMNRPAEFDRPLLSMVMGGDGTLLEPYRGYQVNDLRELRRQFDLNR